MEERMNDVIAQARQLAEKQLPPDQILLMLANQFGLKLEPDLSNSEKIGRAVTIGDRRFYGKGRSEEEALTDLFKKIASHPS